MEAMETGLPSFLKCQRNARGRLRDHKWDLFRRRLNGREGMNNRVGRFTFSQGTPNQEPGTLDDKFAFPSHCVVFLLGVL